VAQATAVFPRTVLRAAAALTNYSVGFSGDDHHVGNLQLQVDPIVNGDAVIVNVTFGLRDWSGNWDDNYQADVEVAVIAELTSPTAPPPRTDVSIVSAEFSQATQFFQSYRHLDSSTAMPDNSIRLVGGKNTGIRLYVDYDASASTAPIATLSGTLRVTTTSGATTTFSPLAFIVPMPQVAIDRGNVAHTLNFMIPGIWCHDQLTIEIEVFDAAAPLTTSAPYVRTIRFVDAVPLEVFGVGIHYTGQGLNLPAPSESDFATTLDFTERVYPVGEVRVAGYQTHDYDRDLKPSDDGDDTPGYDGLLDLLLDLRGGGDEAYLALLPGGGIDVEIDTTGWSVDGIERSGVGVSFVNHGPSVAHEIAHAFGRDHASCDSSARCDDPDSPDDHYPHYGVYPSDSIGEFGFDPIANNVKDPAVTFDFMGYSGSDWTSPYTYTALMGALPPTGGAPIGSSVSHAMLRRVTDRRHEGPGLLLRCTIHTDGTVEIEPSFTHEVRTVPLRGKSAWRVEQRSSSGEVLSCVPLTVRTRCACRPLRVRQLIPRTPKADTLALVHKGKDVLVEPFGEPPRVEAKLHAAEKSIEISWTGELGIWVVVQGLDQQGVWRGLAGRTQERTIRLDAATIRKRRYRKIRLLAVQKLATTIIDLPYDPPPTVAEATIITKVVAPGVIKGWIVGDDGPERAELVWTDEHGAEIGRGHTLDLRGRRPLTLIRAFARHPSRYVPSRVIALAHGPRYLRIEHDASVEVRRTPPVAAHRSKPRHRH
jgi:hypothetical protein